ncbi:MAG: penicillin-binding protein [Ignavibacteria bacterium]|nr:penicillin-binding protein [Ignavibacteria bacterium]
MTPLKFVLLIFITFLIAAGALAFYVSSVLNEGLPSIEQLENPKQNLATQILSSDGELLDHFFIERRVPLAYDSIPKAFINALIATEDRKFFEHWGVHVNRVATAAIKNVLAGHTKEGASTITMQLARNLYTGFENSLSRKIREAFTAVQIEKTYTKQEILEMYTNTVIFGRGAYGIQVAAKAYFDKSPSELTLAECAFLVGLLKNPERYNGRGGMEIALTRRNLVLDMMHEQQLISDAQYIKALDEPILLKAGKGYRGQSYLAPHFVEMVRQKLGKDSRLEDYDLYRDGLIIHTTINSRIQRYANQAIEEHLAEFQKQFDATWSWRNNAKLLSELVAKAISNRADYKAATKEKKEEISTYYRNNKKFIDSIKNAATTIQSGLVVINPMDGAILAMVGASPKFIREHADFKYSLNHVTQIQRQAGSSFKPFVYALALDNGMTPSSVVECGPFSYKLPNGEVWSPRGAAKNGESTMTLGDALRLSINTVAARLITSITDPFAVISLVRQLGIESPMKAVPAIALGAGGEVTPLEMTAAYGAFDNYGYYVEPYFYSKIEDHFGNPLYTRKETGKITDALKKDVAITLTRMLQSVVDAGTGSRVRQYFTGVDAAGKTGTTNESADAWFVGYTPQLVAGVWVGFDDMRVNFDCIGSEGYAGRASAPIWGRLMAKIYADDQLPFKQKKFDFNRSDTTKDSSLVASTSNVKPTPAPQIKPVDKKEPVKKPDSKVKATPAQKNAVFPKLKNQNTDVKKKAG